MNSSATDSCTRIRSVPMQSCPALPNDARSVISAAFSRSASARMTTAFLPPSSSEQPTSRSPARTATSRPTRVEPVNIT